MFTALWRAAFFHCQGVHDLLLLRRERVLQRLDHAGLVLDNLVERQRHLLDADAVPPHPSLHEIS